MIKTNKILKENRRCVKLTRRSFFLSLDEKKMNTKTDNRRLCRNRVKFTLQCRLEKKNIHGHKQKRQPFKGFVFRFSHSSEQTKEIHDNNSLWSVLIFAHKRINNEVPIPNSGKNVELQLMYQIKFPEMIQTLL